MTYDAVGHSHGRFAWSLHHCLLWPSLRECEEFVDRVLVWERCLGHWPGRSHWKKESKKLLQTQTEMPKPRSSNPILIEIWFYCFLIPWPDGSSLQEFDAICPLANQLVVKLFNIYHQILDCGTRVRWNYFPSLAVEIFRPKCRIVGNEVKLVLAIFIPTSGYAPLRVISCFVIILKCRISKVSTQPQPSLAYPAELSG